MDIKFFCPRWGAEDMNMTLFCQKVKAAGYNGVEMSLPSNQAEKDAIVNELHKFGLELIAQHWETLTSDFESHKHEYRVRLINLALSCPLFINTQTGKDFFSFDQNAELISIASEISEKYGVKIVHETHRGKFSFAAHILAEYLRKIPGLRLTLDISHWCCVAESWLDDQPDSVTMALSRTDHIHSRVGFPQGPQIPDPRVPEWCEALEKYTSLWQQVITQRKNEGNRIFTITSEFGPRPYMPLLPYTQQPVANQWEVNLFMKDHLNSVFSTK